MELEFSLVVTISSQTCAIRIRPIHRIILILSSHLPLGLPRGLFPSDIPTSWLNGYRHFDTT